MIIILKQDNKCYNCDKVVFKTEGITTILELRLWKEDGSYEAVKLRIFFHYDEIEAIDSSAK